MVPHSKAAAPVDEDPVLATFDRAPTCNRDETDEERGAVEAAKASGAFVVLADVQRMIDQWRASEE